MRRSICFFAALVFVLPASAAPRRTVLDYFKMLPSKRFFDIEEPPISHSRVEYLREGLSSEYPAFNRSIIDLKNDFLRFPGDGAQYRLDIAVFRFHGQDTVAVLSRMAWDEDLSFWHERNGRLQEVTKSVLPFRLSDNVAFEVPRYGTTLRVLATTHEGEPTQKVVARFLWRDGRFVRG